jgi:hypothetical protein
VGALGVLGDACEHDHVRASGAEAKERAQNALSRESGAGEQALRGLIARLDPGLNTRHAGRPEGPVGREAPSPLPT